MNHTCPICFAKDSELVKKYREYTLYRCEECDVVFANPMKMDQGEYEHGEYYMLRNNLIIDPLQWDFRWDIIQFLRRPPLKSGNLLDIGCGTGFFVKRACEMGFNGYGIDFSERAIAKGREYFGLDTLNSMDIRGLKEHFPRLRFDLITLFQVIEHLEDPNKLMSELKDLISADAVIVIALPLRGRWPDTLNDMDRPPHHLTQWSLKAVETFLQRNGYYVRRAEVENFSLRNMQALIYPYVLRLLPSLTIKGRNVDMASMNINLDEALGMLRGMKIKKTIANILGAPVWVVLRLLGAQGPNLYIEASAGP